VRRKPTSVICEDLRGQLAEQIQKGNLANISIDLTQNDLENTQHRGSNPQFKTESLERILGS
jgi:hypothetical protein